MQSKYYKNKNSFDVEAIIPTELIKINTKDFDIMGLVSLHSLNCIMNKLNFD